MAGNCSGRQEQHGGKVTQCNAARPNLEARKTAGDGQRAPHKRGTIATPQAAGAASRLQMAAAARGTAAPGAAITPAKAARVAELVAAIGANEAAAGQPLRALAELRKMLSIESFPPVQAVIDNGGITPLVACIRSGSSAVQLEAAWALTNMASGTSAQTAALVEAGAVQSVFGVLASVSIADRADLCEQCLWVLGNIAGDDDLVLRDQLLAAGVVGHLGELYERLPGFPWDLHGRVQALRSLTRLMSSLCRGRPGPPLEDIDCAFDYFAQVLLGTDDTQMLTDALWGLCYLLEGGADAAGSCLRAVRLLSAGFASGETPTVPHPLLVNVVKCAQVGSEHSPLPLPALRLLGALASAPAEQPTDAAIAAPQVRSDAARALSNVAAGTAVQAQGLLDAAGTFDAVCWALERSPASRMRQECAWVVTNLVKRGSQMIAQLDSRKVLPILTLALKGEADTALQRALLDAIEAVMRCGDEQAAAKGATGNTLAMLAEECELVRELEGMRHAQDEGVYRRVGRLLDTWFRDAADRENEPPEERTPQKRTPKKDLAVARTPSAICGGSPIRPAAYKFGAETVSSLPPSAQRRTARAHGEGPRNSTLSPRRQQPWGPSMRALSAMA
eukprot:CAMPEP_0179072922 /NCGR_PEP_ID=MMETSP0796-20121207/32305_1 /TAXON_ID=73915 /ORGANISM="Pyrodinium bahamense, Strain pbaha01" /LENGTH=618 /DNA_ID=CAMNT_0020770099 /DNA_START=59 /DNA_END=1913 /DNA_ORIENTATION=-